MQNKTNFTVKIDGLEELKRSLSYLGREGKMAIAKSLTEVAKRAKTQQVANMGQVFDRPVPYVLNSLYVKMATPENLMSTVWLREYAGKGTQAEKFLGPQIYGGSRVLKRFERALLHKGILPQNMYAVPGKACDQDAYGNMKPSQIVQILSYLGAFGEQGYRANMTQAKQKQLAGKGVSYFVIKKRQGILDAGIYKRSGMSISPVLIFIRKPTYRKRFDFHGIGERVFKNEWRSVFDEKIRDVLKVM